MLPVTVVRYIGIRANVNFSFLSRSTCIKATSSQPISRLKSASATTLRSVTQNIVFSRGVNLYVIHVSLTDFHYFDWLTDVRGNPYRFGGKKKLNFFVTFFFFYHSRFP